MNNDNIQLYCGFDWSYVLDLNTLNTNPSSLCSNYQFIQENIINKILHNEIVLKLPDINSNEILCDNDTNCITYVLKQHNPIHRIECPTGIFFCSVYWFDNIFCLMFVHIYCNIIA